LIERNSLGRFTEPIQAALDSDATLLSEIAIRLLDSHFPASLHENILGAAGLDVDWSGVGRRKRDSSFRPRVLAAYERRCAVCELDLRIGPISAALEAAHIKWHQAGGPDDETNGLALCTLHHKLFDLGAFTLDASLRILVSDQIVGSAGKQEVLLQFHGRRIVGPQRPEQEPSSEFVAWHAKEVFKGEARHLAE